MSDKGRLGDAASLDLFHVIKSTWNRSKFVPDGSGPDDTIFAAVIISTSNVNK